MAASRALVRACPLSRRLPAAAGSHSYGLPVRRQRGSFPLQQQSRKASSASDTEADPDMNGNYPNPPAIKRQFRDPHADWWDKTQRKNFGEPVHEDDDILGTLSPDRYPFFPASKAFILWGGFISAVAGLYTVVRYTTEGQPPAAPRTFPGGLEEELGGPGAVRALKPGEDANFVNPR